MHIRSNEILFNKVFICLSRQFNIFICFHRNHPFESNHLWLPIKLSKIWVLKCLSCWQSFLRIKFQHFVQQIYTIFITLRTKELFRWFLSHLTTLSQQTWSNLPNLPQLFSWRSTHNLQYFLKMTYSWVTIEQRTFHHHLCKYTTNTPYIRLFIVIIRT